MLLMLLMQKSLMWNFHH